MLHPVFPTRILRNKNNDNSRLIICLKR